MPSLPRPALASVAGAVVAVGAAVMTRLILWPQTRDDPGPVDALVVLGGGGGERLKVGVDLVRRGVSSKLVVSTGPNWAMDRLGFRCGDNDGVEVLCFQPDPDRTAGEARHVGALAAERGWTRIAVVTSTYHVTRARLLFRRCVAGEVVMVAAPTPRTPRGLARNLPREAAGLVAALTVERGCR